MNKKILNDIEAIITCFQIAPGAFDNNVWRCYTDCKQALYAVEKNGIIPYNNKLYNKYINYIRERLDI